MNNNDINNNNSYYDDGDADGYYYSYYFICCVCFKMYVSNIYIITKIKCPSLNSQDDHSEVLKKISQADIRWCHKW